MLRVLVMILSVLAGPLLADTQPSLPEAALKRIKSDPDRFFEAAAVLIHGYGTGGRINGAGVERFIAMERAGARAAAARRLMAADMNADGRIDADEIALLAAAASARSRGKLLTLQARADTDGDGSVSPAELTAHAATEAVSAFPESRAQAARAVLACDQDGDGQVDLPEVRRALAALEQAA